MRTSKAVQGLAIAGAVTALVAGCGSSSKGSSGTLVNPSSGASGGVGNNLSIKALLAGSVDKADNAKNAKIHIDFSGTTAGQSLTSAATASPTSPARSSSSASSFRPGPGSAAPSRSA